MAIKSVKSIVNGVTTTLTYESGHYYGVQIIATDEAGNSTTVNQSDATLGSKLRLTVKEKTAPVITISAPTASQLLTSNQPTITFTVTDDDSGVNPLMDLKYPVLQRQKHHPVIRAVINLRRHWQMAHIP